MDFVRKAIKAIGQAAIKIDEGAERCVNVLLELIATRVSYVVQEAVVVMKVCVQVHLQMFLVLNPVSGYFPKISIAIRGCDPNTMRKS